MTQVHPFRLPTEDSLIELNCKVNGQNLTLALDTGASHTTIDLSFLIVAGIEPAEAAATVMLETGKGPVEAQIFTLDSIEALGLKHPGFPVCAYDFLSNNILSAIDGVLGLDFFRGCDLNISFKRFEISVTSPTTD